MTAAENDGRSSKQTAWATRSHTNNRRDEFTMTPTGLRLLADLRSSLEAQTPRNALGFCNVRDKRAENSAEVFPANRYRLGGQRK